MNKFRTSLRYFFATTGTITFFLTYFRLSSLDIDAITINQAKITAVVGVSYILISYICYRLLDKKAQTYCE